MAWRAVGRKGISSSFSKALARSSVASVSKCEGQDFARVLSTPLRHLPGNTTTFLGADKDLTFSSRRCLIRCFHASSELLAKRKPPDESTPNRSKKVHSGKFSKRKKVTQPPVDTPYMPPKLKRTAKSLDKTIEIFEGISVIELAKRCGESIASIQNIITNVGEKANSEFDALSIDIAELVAMEVGVNVRRMHLEDGLQKLPRPPVVTVMGHVDHGKTSLLDALRQTSVAAKEAGGITQHLGAFVVAMQSGAFITFLDTPGHAAFSAMRARGAAITDLVVLVVAADDGVMPQTLEAMSHAKAANVGIIVAINKCDKPDANPERVKVQLASEGLSLEEMGGDVQVVEVSALKGTGLDSLEEAVLLQAELMDLKARVDGPAQAYVVEARLDKGRGPLATAIVKAGTLLSGQHVVVGSQWGKIRCIRDTARNVISKATPAMPVEIEGLKGLPMAGDDIVVVESEERAKMLSEGRKRKKEIDRLNKLQDERRQELELEQEMLKDEENEDEKARPKRVEVPIIVKGDVQGTVQAVTDALKCLNSPQVLLKIIQAGVGPVSQSDVDLAAACDACVVGFNVRNPPAEVTLAATQKKIKIKLHRVIYHLLEDIGNFIVEKAPGTLETQVAGEAQVLNVFIVKGKGKSKGIDLKIAGCRVMDGRLAKTSTLRLLRSGEVAFEGNCLSLKREDKDVDAVGKGIECGLMIEDCHDIQVGDMIQCLVKVTRKPKFVSSESGEVRIEC